MGRRRLPRCPATGKVRFRDHHDATQALAAARRSTSDRRREQRSYLCATCRGFHLTSRA
jgi:hypothetical protein